MKKKNLAKWLTIMTLTGIVMACSDSGDETSEGFPEQIHMVIRFETGSGVNAVDSMKLLKFDGEGFKSVNMDTIQITCTRESDGAMTSSIGEIDKSNMGFAYAGWVDCSYPDEADDTTGTALHLLLHDFNVTARYDHEPRNYDDVYTIRFKSPLIFGNTEEHYVSWYVHLIGYRFSVYRCVVDGEDFDFMNEYHLLKEHDFKYHYDEEKNMYEWYDYAGNPSICSIYNVLIPIRLR